MAHIDIDITFAVQLENNVKPIKQKTMLTKEEKKQKRWEVYKALCAEKARCVYANGYQCVFNKDSLELMYADAVEAVEVFEKSIN